MTSYKEDEVGWALEQAELARRGAVNSLDLEHIAEELEEMADSRKDAVSSYINRLIHHMLKWKYQPEKRTRSWEDSIDGSREQIFRKTKGRHGSTVVYNEIPDYIKDEYPSAVKKAMKETGLPRTTFPNECEWTREQLLEEDFYPKSVEEDKTP